MRPSVNELSAADRQKVVAALMGAIDDELVSWNTRGPDPGNQLIKERALALRGVDLLERAGLPLPYWNPADRIPKDFMVVKPTDAGTPRAPLMNAVPGLAVPSELCLPGLARYAVPPDPWSRVGVPLIAYEQAGGAAVGGVLADGNQLAAAPVYWCWCAWVLETMNALQASRDRPDPAAGFAGIACGPNADRRLQFFLNGKGGDLYTAAQQHAAGRWDDWTAWDRISEDFSRTHVTRARDLRLELIGYRQGLLHSCTQAELNSRRWLHPMQVEKDPGLAISGFDVSQSAEGRIDIFGIYGGGLYNLWQDPQGGDLWGPWGYVGGDGIREPSIRVNQMPDRTVMVTHIGSDGQVWVLTQYPEGPCRDPYRITGGLPVGKVATTLNSGGKLTVFAVRSGSNALDVGFSNEADGHWEAFKPNVDSDVREICPVTNRNGRMEIFMIDANDGRVRHRYQDCWPGGREWLVASEIGPSRGVTALAAGIDAADCVELFAIRPDADGDRVLRAVQRTPGDPNSYTDFAVFY